MELAGRTRPHPVALFLLAASTYLFLAMVGMLPGSLHLFDQWFTWFEDPTGNYRVWWFSQVMSGNGGSIWEMPLLLYPTGINTMMQSNGLAKELLAALLGGGRAPWLAGNIIAVTTPATVALTAYLVLRRLLRGAFLPALVGGWLTGWSGQFLGHMVSPWMASSEGLVLFLAAVLMMRRRCDWRLASLAGVAAALAIWLQMQFLVHIVVVAAVYLVDRMMVKDWRGGGMMFLSGGVAIVLTLPLLIATWQAYGGDMELMAGGDSEEAMLLWRNHLAQFFLPPRDMMPLGTVSSLLIDAGLPINPHRVPYLGWVVLPLAWIGWRTKHRGTGFLALIAVVFTLLSCGPVISLFVEPWTATNPGGEEWSLFGLTWIPGPFYFLKDLPLISSMRVPGRFIATTQLALGLLAGFGLLRLFRARWVRKSALRRAGVAAALLILHFNVNAWPVYFAPNQYTPFWKTIAEQPGEFSVMDLPYSRGMHQYVHYGAYHQKGVIFGFGSRVPEAYLSRVELDFNFPGINARWNRTEWPDINVENFAESLVRYKVKYVLFHELHLQLKGRLSIVAESDPSLLGYRDHLINYWEDPTIWEKQSLIQPPKLVWQDDVVRAYEVRAIGNGG